jgi:hypothetical protein
MSLYDYYEIEVKYTCDYCEETITKLGVEVATWHTTAIFDCDYCDREIVQPLPCSADTVLRMIDAMDKSSWAMFYIRAWEHTDTSGDIENLEDWFNKPWKWIGEVTQYLWANLDVYYWENYVEKVGA